AVGSEAGDGLAITSTGAVRAWGQNADGELGNGHTGNANAPQSLVLPSGVIANTIGQGFGYTGLAVVATPPVISSVSPTLAVAGGGTTVTISGAGLTGATAVPFGGKPAASFKVNSPTRITAVTPAGTGTVNVSVTGPGGTSAITAQDRFTYLGNGMAVDWGASDTGELGNGSA